MNQPMREKPKTRRQWFFGLVGEYPEDILGQDWENEIDEYLEFNGFMHEGHLIGQCFVCKDGL